MNTGLDSESTWEVSEFRRGSFRLAVEWLTGTQKSDGSFGEDLWDTCFILRVLLAAGVSKEQDSVKKGVVFVKEAISKDIMVEYSDLEWCGAGYIAQAIMLFSELGETETQSKLTEELAHLQEADGRFGSVGGRYPVWHTAQAILALLNAGQSSTSAPASRATAWLKQSQRKDGSWEEPHLRLAGIMVSHALLSLAQTEGTSAPAFTRGIQWLLSHQEKDGMIIDIPTSSLAGLVLSESSDHSIRLTVSFTDIEGVVKELGKIEADVYAEEENAKSLKAGISKITEFNKFARFVGPTLVGVTAAILVLYFVLVLAPLEALFVSLRLPGYTARLTCEVLIPLVSYYPIAYGFSVALRMADYYRRITKFVSLSIVLGMALTVLTSLI